MRPEGVRIIGLTGGIASGKSSVARFFEERGVPVVDADHLAREAVLPGSAGLAGIVQCFGAIVLNDDGSLNRPLLRNIVFNDADKRCQLEAILHPEIRRLAEERISKCVAEGKRIIVYMAPLLIEAGVDKRVDEIWVVTITADIQLKRLMSRDGISEVEAQRIIDSQMPLSEKERYGRVVINNSGTPQETRRILEVIWEREIGNIYG